MDSARFDGLARAFSQARLRRQTLCGLAALAASGGLALLGLGEARAAFPPKWLTSCPGTLGCVNTQNDSNHCGSCSNQCPGGRGCFGGACECQVSNADSRPMRDDCWLLFRQPPPSRAVVADLWSFCVTTLILVLVAACTWAQFGSSKLRRSMRAF